MRNTTADNMNCLPFFRSPGVYAWENEAKSPPEGGLKGKTSFTRSCFPGVNAWATERTQRWRQSPVDRSRRGMTLVELLVVITIMVVMLGLSATMFKPAGESRRVREAAREVAVYLSSARNRAIETGRPCGVMFRRLSPTMPCAMTIDQCEVPPPYGGDTEGSMAMVQMNSATSMLDATLDASDDPYKLLRNSDQIQFNHQGSGTRS